jgi:hypothetical protein
MLTGCTSVIVTDLDVAGVSVYGSKAEPPLVIHGNRILALAFALQGVKPIARRYSEILQPTRQIHVLQLPDRAPQYVRWKASHLPLREQIQRIQARVQGEPHNQ